MAVEQAADPTTTSSPMRTAAFAVVTMATAVVVLALTQGGPAYFLQLGPEKPAYPHAIEVLGEDVPTPFDDGHDGVFFWELARDPLLTDADALNERLDRPLYRAQRIGYPLLAAPWFLFGEGALLWGLVVTNLLAIGAGTYALARWGVERGRSPAVGYVFILSPFVWIALLFDFGGVVGMAGLVAAVWLFGRGSLGPAIVAAVVAVLARDAMLLGLLGVAVFARGPTLRDRTLLVVPAAVAAGLWRLYASLRLGDEKDSDIVEFTWMPFGGVIDSWDHWWGDGSWGQAVAALVIIGLGLAAVVAFLWRPDDLALAAALPFGLVAPFLSVHVVSLWHNLVRGVGPAIPLLLFFLLTFERDGEKRPAVSTHP